MNDLVLIHFGGSGNEIILTKKLKRNFISAEIDKIYYKMILDRLEIYDGRIPPKYKLQLRRKLENERKEFNPFLRGLIK